MFCTIPFGGPPLFIVYLGIFGTSNVFHFGVFYFERFGVFLEFFFELAVGFFRI